MSQVWAARTGTPEAAFMDFSQSIHEDAAFLKYDIEGSTAHVQGLLHAGLLSDSEAQQLTQGLQSLLKQHQAGTWVFDPSLEDGHMNLESALEAQLGAAAKKLHTGRSRNDQVATCITLFSKDNLEALLAACRDVSSALASQAEQHMETPWVAKTHGQAAQPATLGWLFLAHAFRFQDAAATIKHAIHQVSESPLGSGAVAGSTLHLDPAYTANLLGLRAPRSALLATGTRDTVLVALHAATHVARTCAGLAQDLLDLFHGKAIQIPSGYTTGSSLMPHKRNPDALELVRGHGHAIPSHEHAVQAITTGLGLGYQRDLQLTKPHLLAAFQETLGCLQILAPIVSGCSADAHVLRASLAAPGITATDAVEALVARGMPFRDAYTTLAQIHAAMEAGASFEDALAKQGLADSEEEAILVAMQPDPSRRTTLGAPAPEQVKAALKVWATAQAALEADS